MAKLRVFISSTYYDLKHIRSSMDLFIESLGYESILSEKGSIAYNPNIPLDESCYRELEGCDIFVLIIGGRYGSPASFEGIQPDTASFFTRYESVTKLEYENAIKKDTPVYIIIEKSVYAEYQTYKKNKTNKEIKYAFVDSVNVFEFIEYILSQPKNNPVFQFEKHMDIQNWLILQWSGLFQDLLKNRQIQAEIVSLSQQVKELSNQNTTFKRYLEAIVSNSEEYDGRKIIEEEKDRQNRSKLENALLFHPSIHELVEWHKVTIEDAIKLFERNDTLQGLARDYAQIIKANDGGKKLFDGWKNTPIILERFNSIRHILGLNDLEIL